MHYEFNQFLNLLLGPLLDLLQEMQHAASLCALLRAGSAA